MNLFEKRLAEASQKYYTDGTSDMTDAEFDEMLEEVRKTNPTSKLLDVGHGYDVNKDTTPGNKYEHKYGIAGSLPKCHNWQELKQSLKTSEVDESLKLDGISVVLYYVDNKLVRALTRGDGKVGIDITDKVKKIIDNELHYDKLFTGAIRGEILMNYSNFEEFKKTHPEAKNPRNMTAGIINSKDGEGVEYLSLIVYTVVGSETISFNTIEDVRDFLHESFRAKNLIDSSTNVVNHTSLTTLDEEFFESSMDFNRRTWYGPYPADGIVITSKNLIHSGKYGIEYDAQAYKFKSEVKRTTVVGVEWNMSKTCYAVPTVVVEPVELAGTTVQRATGFNAEFIKHESIGKGTVVDITKSGEIIPYIVRSLHRCDPDMIYNCPECGSQLYWSGVNKVCTNLLCPSRTRWDTLVWLENLSPYDGLGDTLKLKFLNELVDNGIIDDISVESIMEAESVFLGKDDQVKRNDFNNMWNNLHSESKINIVDCLKALNIPRISDSNAVKLSDYRDDINMMKDAALGDLTLYEDFWDSLSKKIGFANAVSCEDNLWKFGRLEYIEKYKTIQYADRIEFVKVAVTGKLSVKRSEFEKELLDNGFKVGDISKDTKYLITDDPNTSTSKNIKADKLGVEKITEYEFRKRYSL